MNSDKNVILIIQARMGSKRLPGKSMLDLAGKPLVARIIERVKRCKSFNNIVLAIPNTEENKVLKYVAEQYSIDVYMGSEDDLLDRYFQAGRLFQADLIARLPADNPTPEPSEIDKLVNFHLKLDRPSFSSNLSPFYNSGYPDGIGIEVFDFCLLKDALNNDDLQKREHVHLNFFNYEKQKPVNEEWCPVKTINCPREFTRPELVLDVNTEEQYLFMKELYGYLYPRNKFFTIMDTLNWYDNIYTKN